MRYEKYVVVGTTRCVSGAGGPQVARGRPRASSMRGACLAMCLGRPTGYVVMYILKYFGRFVVVLAEATFVSETHRLIGHYQDAHHFGGDTSSRKC